MERVRMRRLPLILLFYSVEAVGAEGESFDVAEATAEIDHQIARLKESPPDIEIVFDPLVDKKYKLLSASFELDDKPLPYDVNNPSAPLFRGRLDPGPHLVWVKITYNEAQGSGIFEYADYKLTVTSTVKIDAQDGLRSHVHLLVEEHASPIAKQRLSLVTRVASEMLAKVDDSPVFLTSSIPAPKAQAQWSGEQPTPAATQAPRRHPPVPLLAQATPGAGPRRSVAEARSTLDAGPSDDGGSSAAQDGRGLVAVNPSPAPAPPPPAPVDEDGSRHIWGLAVLGAAGIAALAWLFMRRRR